MENELFMLKYQKEKNIADIDWGDFPTELQEAGLRFMRHWADTLPIRNLRELSGFDDMSVDDLIFYAKEEQHG